MVNKIKPRKIETKRIFAIMPRYIDGKLYWFQHIYVLKLTLIILLDEILEFELNYEFIDEESLNKKLEEYDLE